ncbi:hypothetical protein BV20DRAFT_872458 [Pilatotrama ljubarskyi]|nr:hypothetical protein BV20DRAFT_872458 [Pilatotrama ljubarskyi]
MSVARAHMSALAQSRHANVFVWWPSQPEIIACFNAGTVAEVTAQTWVRWITMILHTSGELIVRRVTVAEGSEAFQYRLIEGATLGESDALSPGDYVCVYTDRTRRYWRSPFQAYNFGTLAHSKNVWERESPNAADFRLEEYIIPEALKNEAARRDGGRCVLTGSSSGNKTEVVVNWIFPSAHIHYTQAPTLYAGTSSEAIDVFRVSANLMTMRADLYELWHSNAFSIDVDDGYRMRIFDESALNVGLPERLDGPRQEWDMFIREHFHYTLIVRVAGGDIGEDYDPATVQAFKESMGLDATEGIVQLDLSDAVWKTPMGAEVLEHELAWRAKRQALPGNDGAAIPTNQTSG